MSTKTNDHTTNANASNIPHWTRLCIGINQLSGPAGCAKTQIALSACLQAALPKPATATATTLHPSRVAAVYLSLGSSRHTKLAQRLETMASATTFATPFHADHHDSNNNKENDPLQRILIKAIMTPESLLQTIQQDVVTLFQNNPNIEILVLDDIATLFRVLEGSVMERSATLFQLAALLKQLSDKFHVPVLVLNQVTTKLRLLTNTMVGTSNNSSSDTPSHNHSSSSTTTEEPALGLSWAQCVNQSFAVTKQEGGNKKRVLALERSHQYGYKEMEFQVQDCGVLMS
jgi:RecA/RadA recombinase